MLSKIFLSIACLTFLFPNVLYADVSVYKIDPEKSSVKMRVAIKDGDQTKNFSCHFDMKKTETPFSGSFEFESKVFNFGSADTTKINLEKSKLDLSLLLNSLECEGGEESVTEVLDILNANEDSKIAFKSTEMNIGLFGGLDMKGMIKINGEKSEEYVEEGILNYKYIDCDSAHGRITLTNELLYEGKIKHINLSHHKLYPKNSSFDNKQEGMASLELRLFAVSE